MSVYASRVRFPFCEVLAVNEATEDPELVSGGSVRTLVSVIVPTLHVAINTPAIWRSSVENVFRRLAEL